MLATVRTMLTIGGNPRGAYFNGAIDEFRMWNVARSQADIMATMGTKLVGNEAGLVGYWKFDDGTGTTAKDSVTTAGHTAHDGTLMASEPDDDSRPGSLPPRRFSARDSGWCRREVAARRRVDPACWARARRRCPAASRAAAPAAWAAPPRPAGKEAKAARPGRAARAAAAGGGR